MAVPSSGSLSLFGLAKEKTHDNYGSTIPVGTWQDNFFDYASLTDATTGAGNYDPTNTNSSSKPDNTTPHKMSEWYGYDHDATASSSACIQVVHSNFVGSNQYSTSGCGSTTAITANSGNVGGNSGSSLIFINRYVRYRNITGSTKNYNIRLHRENADCATLKVYKGYNASTFGYSTGGDMSLVHTKNSTGYTTYTGTIDDDDELLVIIQHSNTASCDSSIRACSISNLYYHGTSCSYNGTMYAVPILGSGSSTAYQYSSGSSALTAGYQQRYNSSSWSTAYIHQCAGQSWTVGNTIYQTNGTSGSEVAFAGTGWRCGSFPSTTYTNNGYPGGGITNVIAFYNAFHATGNIENTYYDPGL